MEWLARARRSRWLDHLRQDIRYALRDLRRSPGFTAAVMVTLGLGIGANAAMFGVVDQLMFRPFPYLRDPGRVNRVYLQITGRSRLITRSEYPYTNYLDLKSATTSIAEYAAVAERALAIGTGETARERPVAGVSASFFDFFDARPARGRFFGAAEDSIPLGASVVVLGHAFWREAFGGADVVGRSLQIGAATHTIIGVAPAGFVGITDGPPPAVFIPITTFPLAAGENKVDSYFREYNWDWMGAVIRRKPGVSEAAATADLTAGFIRSRAAQRAINPGMTPDALARPCAIAGALKTPAGPGAGLESETLLWVTGVAAIVLLIACANVANLMVARVIRRRREFAMRLALGISRGRLLAQNLTESAILAILGAAVGVAVAEWGGAALRRLVLGEGSSLSVVTDWRTLAVALALGLTTAVVTAVGPGFVALRGDLAGTLRAGVREGTYQRSRIRSGLLVVQGALSVILLVGAGLFVRSLQNVRALRLGYDPELVLMVRPEYRGLRMDSSAQVTFRRRLLEAAQAVPGVRFAARVNSRPFGTNTSWLSVPGIDSVARLGRFNFQLGTPDYFKVMGTRIVRGRAFTADDGERAPPVAVVSESMGRTLWPGQDPIGRCLQVRFRPPPRDPSAATPCTTVVGIAQDAVQQSLADDQRLMYYLPLDQVDPSWGNQIFLRVADENAAAAAERIRRALQPMMPGSGYLTVSPMGGLVAAQRRSWELGATMFAGFGVLALLVAAVGLYGIIAYTVAQRTHELGVRVALGADAPALVRLVIGQGVRLAAAGVVIGLALALAAAPWIEPLLFQESATDPATYLGVSALMVLVAVAASAGPAVRATRADPNAALRSD